MAAYIITWHSDITDEAAFTEVRNRIVAGAQARGAKSLVYTGELDIVEGDWDVQRIAVLEFPTVDEAKAWIDSDELAALRAARSRVANARAVIVPGV